MSKGLTFIEVLVVSALIFIVTASVFGLQYAFGQNQVIVWRDFTNVGDANSIVREINREIRNSQPAANGAYLIDTAGDFEIIFYSDYDFDSVTEKLRYSLNGSTLVKGITEPTENPPSYPSTQEKTIVLSTKIRNGQEPLFKYYNGSWPVDTISNPLASGNRIAQTQGVGIYLKLNQDITNNANDYIVESFAQIRLLKQN